MPVQKIEAVKAVASAGQGTSVVHAASLFTSLAGLVSEQASAVASKAKVPFDVTSREHTQLINDCSQAVKDKLQALQSIDKRIATGLAAGLGGSVLAIFLPFLFGPVATAGFIYFGYQWGLRQQAYLDYTTALENLRNCCEWALGKVSSEELRTGAIRKDPAVVTMMQTLAPLTNSKQLKDILDDKIEDGVIESVQDAAANAKFLDAKLEESQLSLLYRIYGYKQGGFLDILKGLWYTIKNMFYSKVNPAQVVHAPDHGKGKGAPVDGPVPVGAAPETATSAKPVTATATATASASASAAPAENDAEHGEPVATARMS